MFTKKTEKKEFGVNNIPDSTWQFVDRKQTLIQKGKNNIPLINDFSFTTESGNDTTEAILGQEGEYYLMYTSLFDEIKNPAKDWMEDIILLIKANTLNKKLFIVTTQIEQSKKRYQVFIEGKKITQPIFTCDATALKTVARSNPTLYLMNGSIVKQKWGLGDFKKVFK